MKEKYIVTTNHKSSKVYVTTTRNCEDMIDEILDNTPALLYIERIDNGNPQRIYGARIMNKNRKQFKTLMGNVLTAS